MSEQQHLCHSGTPLSYCTQTGAWAPYSHSLTQDRQKKSKMGSKQCRRCRDFFDPVEHASPSLALCNSLCSHIFLFGMTSTPGPRRGSQENYPCSKEGELSFRALRVVTDCSQHFYGAGKVRPGHLGVPVLSLLMHIPAFYTLPAPHLQHRRFSC